MAKLTLLIVDDHAMFRDGLRLLLEHQEGMTVVGEAGDGLSAVRMAGELAPDIILMDLHMPGYSGIEAIREIIAGNPASRIIVLTMYHDDDLIDRAIHAGAMGYILKDSRAVELLNAIRAVAAGRVAIDSDVAARLVALYRGGVPDHEPGSALRLSQRQTQILSLIADGLTNREIAQTLFLSEQTVKNVVSSLFQKLGAHNRTEAVSVALRAGVISAKK